MIATKAARRQGKIAHLGALINHPRTPENEREAAKAMLARLIAKQETATSHSGGTRGMYQRVYGEKYNRVPKHAPTKDIAKAIREDIKLARKIAKQASGDSDIKLADPIGDAPIEIKYGVYVPHYGSITIEVRHIPADWGWVTEERNGYTGQFPSEALRTLGRELAAVMGAYNHDGSDTMTDYFDVRFYGHVRAEDGCTIG